MTPPTKLVLGAVAAVAAWFGYVTFAKPRLLSLDEVQKIAPDAGPYLANGTVPHQLGVGQHILLAVSNGGAGFKLLAASVTKDDPDAKTGYVTVKTAVGQTYHLSTTDENDAYFDADTKGIVDWASKYAHL